jgi:hypothetical protein
VTDLFLATRGLDARVVADAVPPAVRRSPETESRVTRDGRDQVIDLGPWEPRAPACHILPSIAVLAVPDHAVRFEIAGRRGGAWTPWLATATLGDDVFTRMPTAMDGMAAEIDEVRAAPAVEAVRLRVRVRAGTDLLERASWLVSCSLWDGGVTLTASAPSRAVRLDVPARTQLSEDEATRMRICSPTSLGMAMEYLGCAVPTAELAASVFHAATDRYGVWPAAVRAAAAHRLPGYLLRFPGWDAAAWCLERGLPIVASVRFEHGELTGAPLSDTTGHLIVITGIDGDDVLVNDPAAATVGAVPCRYRRDQMSRVWLERSGVGYVFFRAEGGSGP